MPPIAKTTKKDVITAAHALIKRDGLSALNARSLAGELGTSTQPIFSNFSSMDEFMSELTAEAYRMFREYIEKTLLENKFPPYKASGIAYIRFAREEREMFKLLFMTKKGADAHANILDPYDDIISAMAKSLGIDHDTAQKMHTQIWIWLHGAASLIVSDYITTDEDTLSKMLSIVYASIKEHYTKNKDLI